MIRTYTQEEITEIYYRQADTVWRVCVTFLGNTAAAEDAMQDVFMQLLSGKVLFQSEEHERGWMIVTASNICKNRLRKKEYFHDNLEDYDRHHGLSDEEGSAVSREDAVAVREAILALPAKYKEVVYLHYYEGYTTEEIARLTGMRPATIRSQLLRARKMLQKSLED